jgi:isoleucyl-tRNA synthetase
LYANIDKFDFSEAEIPYEERPEIDRWILSELNSLIEEVDNDYQNYEPTKAGRAIAEFVDAHLSNWYVRLSRRRFWKSDVTSDKTSAYQTLYTCLNVLAKISSPIAPFFAERLYQDLNAATGREAAESVHLTDFPKANPALIDKDLEERMEMAQLASSMVLSLRKKANIRVRQPLSKIMIPVNSEKELEQFKKIEQLILSEVNVKEIEYLTADKNILVKKVKPNLRNLGRRYGKMIKQITQFFAEIEQETIRTFESVGYLDITLDGQDLHLELDDAIITTEDIPGWAVTTQDDSTVALDITITPELAEEGLAREIVNRIQNMRKDGDFEVTDHIILTIEKNDSINNVVEKYKEYICSETLATLNMVDNIGENIEELELIDNISVKIKINKN